MAKNDKQREQDDRAKGKRPDGRPIDAPNPSHPVGDPHPEDHGYPPRPLTEQERTMRTGATGRDTIAEQREQAKEAEQSAEEQSNGGGNDGGNQE